MSPFWPDSIGLLADVPGPPEFQLALDDELLAAVDRRDHPPVLRFWESVSEAVILGRSNQAETEVSLPTCIEEKVAVWRRSSGGGTVVVGPGCLAFTLVLPLNDVLRAKGAAQVTRWLLEHLVVPFPETPPIVIQGVSDLTYEGRKFSGNAQRWRRNAFLHHGTILYNFPLARIAKLLRTPSRQPDYREARDHSAFVGNYPATARPLRSWMAAAWQAHLIGQPSPDLLDAASRLASERGLDPKWCLRPSAISEIR